MKQELVPWKDKKIDKHTLSKTHQEKKGGAK